MPGSSITYNQMRLGATPVKESSHKPKLLYSTPLTRKSDKKTPNHIAVGRTLKPSSLIYDTPEKSRVSEELTMSMLKSPVDEEPISIDVKIETKKEDAKVQQAETAAPTDTDVKAEDKVEEQPVEQKRVLNYGGFGGGFGQKKPEETKQDEAAAPPQPKAFGSFGNFKMG